jgi:hypothetical protein
MKQLKTTGIPLPWFTLIDFCYYVAIMTTL